MPVNVGNQNSDGGHSPFAPPYVGVNLAEVDACAKDAQAKGDFHTALVLRWAHDELRKRGAK